MGVPKFYRWLSERYPCLSEVVKEHQIPEFDNLYLDMNGIIHICSHPNDDDPHFRITEEQIFANIFHYIEVLFRMIQPRKVFFLAVDGVAPRAKMNQQRGRRFRSAKEAEMNEKRAKDRGEELPEEARFDSNCITPGTPFMVRLHSQLQYFITNKVSTDPLWRKVRVILSGHQTPGEGEHKIMDFIRYEKAQPEYDPNIRHCLYGLDADLMMLGMCTHDPHFSLLREEVRFGGKKNASANKRIVAPEHTTFHLLHLSLLREYLDHEFSDMRDQLPFEYDIESIIDDWVLLGFLVGNDFIPHLPHLHINKGALHELYSSYKKCLPRLGGYLNVHGHLNLARFEVFMRTLAEKELERFDSIYSNSKWLEGKTAHRNASGKHTIKSTPGPGNVVDLLGGHTGEPKATAAHGRSQDVDLAKLLNSADEFFDEDEADFEDIGEAAADDCSDGTLESSDSRGSIYHMEFRQHKREYYINKLGYPKVDDAVLKDQALCYVRAIQWNLHYYYNGCRSWSWFYPHHFAPWITDIRDFSKMELNFEMSIPFLPFEQLLAVLPAASKELLPQPLQGLMLNPSSPIIDYYPKDFENDLNGKQQDWEAVVLIPFIDEARLLAAMKPPLSHLKPDEAARNMHGPMSVYQYTPTCLGEYEAPAFFPVVTMNYAKCSDVYREDWVVDIPRLKKGLMAGVRLDVFFPGFPTLKHLPHSAKLRVDGVRVFEQASRGENMIVFLEGQTSVSAIDVAESLLNQEVWVGWPHMTEAKVVSISDSKTRHSVRSNGKITSEETNQDMLAKYRVNKKSLVEKYRSRWGIAIGAGEVVIEALPMTGRKYVYGQKGKITLEKQWGQFPQPFAHQTVLKDILVHDPSFTQYRTLDELFPTDSSCFMLGNIVYGCLGSVQEVVSGRIRIRFLDFQEPNLQPAIRMNSLQAPKFYPAYQVARYLNIGMSTHLLSRITGTMFVIKGAKGADADRASKCNIGLSLKFNKRNEEVRGFTTRDGEKNWLYSDQVGEIIYEYHEKFPEVFHYLRSKNNASNDVHYVEDVFQFTNADPFERLTELSSWLKDLPSTAAPRQACGTLSLYPEIVQKLEQIVDAEVSGKSPSEEMVLQVKPHLLYKPDLCQGNSLPDEEANFLLFDRVVNVREGFSVPLGLRGTVTGILKTEGSPEVTLEVVFDRSFPGGMTLRSSPGRSYKVPGSAVINLSHGVRKSKKEGTKPMAVVQPIGESRVHPSRVVKVAPPSPEKCSSLPPDPSLLPQPVFFPKKMNKQHHQAASQPKVPPPVDLMSIVPPLPMGGASAGPDHSIGVDQLTRGLQEMVFARSQGGGNWVRGNPHQPRNGLPHPRMAGPPMHRPIRPLDCDYRAVPPPPSLGGNSMFVPMQVHKRHRPRGNHDHKKSQGPPTHPPPSAHGPALESQPLPPPPPTHLPLGRGRGSTRGSARGGRGGGRDRGEKPKKTRIAANFGAGAEG
eukprot:maker-scaffold1137_size60140-snap-gene-0.17 protein:Tk10572 transcript:maker-scaffold1137_size60140-snap-gene-0.17-mRNA-1 annotation:"5 -3 exoribonuclease 1"